MFNKLIESGAESERVGGSAIVSIAAHGVIIAAAVMATSQLRTAKPEVPVPMHRFYFLPPPAEPITPPRTPTRYTRSVQGIPPLSPNIANISVPTLDLGQLVTKPIELPGGTPDVTDGGRRTNGAQAPTGTFSADQVEKQVALAPGSAAPTYPESLRNSGIEGQVVALFVVGVDGRAEIDSVRFVRTDNVLFQDAVRAALRRMRFVPAEIAGRKVRQLVQMPFVFTLKP